MALPRIYADFQNLDDSNRLKLNCAGTRKDLERSGIQLMEGMQLTFYTDDCDDEGNSDELRADGVVQFAEAEKCWVAKIDWNALRHVSEENTASTPLDSVPTKNPEQAKNSSDQDRIAS